MRILVVAVLLLVPTPTSAQTAPQRWHLVEELRIGSADGPQSLTTVNGVLPARDGRLVYVMQRDDHTILVFDAGSGKFVRRIGRSGAGPGEFQGLSGIGWKQDTLYAVDPVLERLSLFTQEGEHLRTERIVSPLLPAAHGPAHPTALNANGTVIGTPWINMMAAANNSVTSNPVVLMNRKGEVLRTLVDVDLRNTRTVASLGSGIMVFTQPMSERTLLRYAPDGSSLVIIDRPASAEHTASFHVTRLGPAGDTLYYGTYGYTPRPLSPAMVDSLYDMFKDVKTVTPATAREAAERAIILPPAQQPVSAAVLSSDGTLWLRREERGPPTVEWLVLDPTGHILARVQTPAGLQLLAVEKGAAWGVVKDELDIPYVIRYRVKRAGGE